jgi:hypothetical protein
MEGEAGALADFRRGCQRDRADLFGSRPLKHSAVAVSPASRLFFSTFKDAMTAFIAFIVSIVDGLKMDAVAATLPPRYGRAGH